MSSGHPIVLVVEGTASTSMGQTWLPILDRVWAGGREMGGDELLRFFSVRRD